MSSFCLVILASTQCLKHPELAGGVFLVVTTLGNVPERQRRTLHSREQYFKHCFLEMRAAHQPSVLPEGMAVGQMEDGISEASVIKENWM